MGVVKNLHAHIFLPTSNSASPIVKSCLRPCSTLYFYIDEHVMLIPDNSSGSNYADPVSTSQSVGVNKPKRYNSQDVKFTNPELAVHLSVEGEEVNNIRNLIH